MIISIELSDVGGIPMWFFNSQIGDKIHLTILDTGPRKLDFSLLTLQEQGYIIGAIEQNVINCDVSVEKLTEKMLETKSSLLQAKTKQMASVPPALVQEWLSHKENTDLEVKKLETEQKIIKQKKNMEELAHILIKQNIKVIKSRLNKEENISLLLRIIQLEKEKPEEKQRDSVIDYVNERLTKLRRAKMREAAKASKKTTSKIRRSDNASYVEYTVKEEENELIEFPVARSASVEEEEEEILPLGVRL